MSYVAISCGLSTALRDKDGVNNYRITYRMRPPLGTGSGFDKERQRL